LEVLLGLAGEADDDVGGDRRVGDRGADLVEDAEERSLR
jgi:hypothetical protein